MKSHEEEELCVDCGAAADGICESCDAPICFKCDGEKWTDVLECRNVVNCSIRIGARL